MGCSQSFGRDGGGCGAVASSTELDGATGDGGGSLRPLRKAKAKAKAASKETKCGTGRLTGARCGLCWRALARRGLSRQDAGDARRHVALKV